MSICDQSTGSGVRKNRREAEISKTCVAYVIYENAWLRQRSVGFMNVLILTNPFEIPMDYAAGVEVAETISDI